MFKSATLPTHLLRGALGLLCLSSGFSGLLPLWAGLPLILLGALALRGCPMCWLMGLIETVAHRRESLPVLQPVAEPPPRPAPTGRAA